MSASLMLGSRRRSDQLDRPDRPNSPTKLDQPSSSTNCLIGVASRYWTMHDPHTTIAMASCPSVCLLHDFNPTTIQIYTIVSTPTPLVRD